MKGEIVMEKTKEMINAESFLGGGHRILRAIESIWRGRGFDDISRGWYVNIDFESAWSLWREAQSLFYCGGTISVVDRTKEATDKAFETIFIFLRDYLANYQGLFNGQADAFSGKLVLLELNWERDANPKRTGETLDGLWNQIFPIIQNQLKQQVQRDNKKADLKDRIDKLEKAIEGFNNGKKKVVEEMILLIWEAFEKYPSKGEQTEGLISSTEEWLKMNRAFLCS